MSTVFRLLIAKSTGSQASGATGDEQTVELLVEFLEASRKSTILIFIHIGITPGSKAAFENLAGFIDQKIVSSLARGTVVSKHRVETHLAIGSPSWHQAKITDFFLGWNSMANISNLQQGTGFFNMPIGVPTVFRYPNMKMRMLLQKANNLLSRGLVPSPIPIGYKANVFQPLSKDLEQILPARMTEEFTAHHFRPPNVVLGAKSVDLLGDVNRHPLRSLGVAFKATMGAALSALTGNADRRFQAQKAITRSLLFAVLTTAVFLTTALGVNAYVAAVHVTSMAPNLELSSYR
jgi:hypothetical protein